MTSNSFPIDFKNMKLQFSKTFLSCDSESPESEAVSPEDVSEVTPESFCDSILSKFLIRMSNYYKIHLKAKIYNNVSVKFDVDNLALTLVHFHIIFLQCQASKEPIGNLFHQNAVEGRERQILQLEQFQSRSKRK